MNDIAKLRAAAVARRKADGIAVNKFLGESVKADPSDYCLDEFKWFCHERENLRLTGDTQDFILKHNKFTNIFRDDDKTSKWIFNKMSNYPLDGPDKRFKAFRQLFMFRLINRVDMLDYMGWANLESLKSLDGKTFTNLGAYQLQPGIGWKYGYSTIKEAIVNGDVFLDLEETYEAAFSSTNQTIADMVAAGNEAFGGYIKFVLFQAILDLLWLTDCPRLDTTPYLGDGSKPAIKAIGLSIEELQEHLQPIFNRKVHLFDAEHALCEYRKYVYQKARLAAGKKISKPYKPNSMGI